MSEKCCKECGKSIPTDSVYCPECGKKQIEKVTAPAPEAPNSEWEKMNAKEKIGRMVEVLARDDPERMMNALLGVQGMMNLVLIGEPAVKPLIQALKRKNGFDRGRAAWTLGKIRDARAVEPLIKSLRDRDRRVRLAAIQALGNIGDGKAVEQLIQIRNEADETRDDTIREFATRALENIARKTR